MMYDAKDLEKLMKQVRAACKAKADLRQLTPEKRAQALQLACHTAAEFDAARLAAGLPPWKPAMPPESTWEFLHEDASKPHCESDETESLATES